MEKQYKININKKPDKNSVLLRWYDYLNSKFGSKAFTKDAAIRLFREHTCKIVADIRFDALWACDCITDNNNKQDKGER